MPMQDKVTIPPKKVTVTDLREVQRNIDAGNVNLDDVIVSPRGRNNFGKGNQIFLNLYDGNSAVTDISGKGNVPQILDRVPYAKGYRPKPSTGGDITPVETPTTVRGVEAPRPGKVNIAGSKPTAARYKAKDRGRARMAVKPDAPESVTPAVVDTNTDAPTSTSGEKYVEYKRKHGMGVEGEQSNVSRLLDKLDNGELGPTKPVLQEKPKLIGMGKPAPERPKPPVARPQPPVARPVAQPPRRKPEILSRATARPNPMARPPRGEGGFVVTPGSRSTAVSRVRPKLKGPSTITRITKAAPVADIAIEGGLSYLTGETDRLDHAAWKGVTSLIPDSGAAGGNTIDIGGKLYTHDKETNMITPMGGGKTQGLAYKGGKPVAVEYGSVKGRTSMVDDVVTPIVETGKAIKETAVRRAKEWTKPKPAATPQRVMAVLNGKEGYMLKGDSSSFRMANWSDAQRNKYYGK